MITTGLMIITVLVKRLHVIWSNKHHPYKHQYYNFEKLRIISTKLSENRDHKIFELSSLKAQVTKVYRLRTTNFIVKEIAHMTIG